MLHAGVASIILCLLTMSGPEEKRYVQNPMKQGSRTNYLLDRMNDLVNFDGLDDPRTTLQDALDYLADRYDLSFDVDEKAFKVAFGKDKPKFVSNEPVANTPIPKMRGIALVRVLEKILDRIDVPSGATYVMHRDQIFITTGAAVSKEILGDSSLPLPRLIHRRFDKSRLGEALEELAEYADATVVLDESVGEKAKETITARFLNSTVDTAVRIVADSCGLTSFRIENVYYVTTREKAAKLREDIVKEKKTPRQMPLAD